MHKRALIAALVASLTIPAAGLPMGSRPDDSRTMYFDGSAFREESRVGQPAIATRIGHYPKLLQEGSPGKTRPLPPETGALAGICYIQQSGGKLGSHPAFLPRPDMPVTVRGAGVEKETRCDGNGFFTLALPPGRYEVRSGADSGTVTIEPDKTTLIPLRGGKRMVD
ncbi:hypothetical protein [Geobacter argillaceus]|uniref:Carboxypeptidase family protein n=1 Tax=Geobacter argillaceus TaxID=345631 RepID=A0A562WRA4_9BACT|nr:hypothetical protein [Geobacter argillaceus]TWJ32928.1 hypothetical protein JN12_00338 [Geobacter argillaceus]